MARSATQIGLSLAAVDVNDKPIQGIQYFVLERKPGAGVFEKIVEIPAGITSYSDTVLSPGTGYTYQISCFSYAMSATTSETIATPAQ